MDTVDRRVLLGAAGLAGVAALAKLAHAGPLNPPAGPVTSTGKTLEEIEPRTAINSVNTPGDADSLFKITQPGSYYLPGNVTGVSGKHGIEIAADNVTVDLMGFSLQGVAGSLTGIISNGFADFITVRNGVVRAWGGSAVEMAALGVARGFLVENLLASENGARGISVQPDAVIRACLAINNGQEGIRARAVSGSGGNIVVEACAASLNGGAGILIGPGASIRGCTCTQNSGGGIATNAGVLVEACAVRGNTGSGIAVGAGSTVVHCTAEGNASGAGIEVFGSCTVLCNTCSSNGTSTSQAGIHVSGARSRIEGNTCLSNSAGVRVTGSGNFIVRNTCSFNTTNWDIAANNFYGGIINRVGVATAAVNGNAATGTLASTDPHANFTY